MIISVIFYILSRNSGLKRNFEAQFIKIFNKELKKYIRHNILPTTLNSFSTLFIFYFLKFLFVSGMELRNFWQNMIFYVFEPLSYYIAFKVELPK